MTNAALYEADYNGYVNSTKTLITSVKKPNYLLIDDEKVYYTTTNSVVIFDLEDNTTTTVTDKLSDAVSLGVIDHFIYVVDTRNGV